MCSSSTYTPIGALLVSSVYVSSDKAYSMNMDHTTNASHLLYEVSEENSLVVVVVVGVVVVVTGVVGVVGVVVDGVVEEVGMTHVSLVVPDPPVHEYPLSTTQELEQPSPDEVLPSSQVSVPTR
mmetsp:Transcript_7225/g.8202  ORF Transcript_7225/g.8202 Transcript_7225/m.8202 type:complete len:124 (-) Transcript_7225:173-544(-)